MKIGVMISNFRQPLEAALDSAVGLGLDGVQLSLSATETADDWQRIADKVRASGLEISAISCDVGDLGEGLDEKGLEKLLPYIDAAVAHGQGICQTHVGIMPHRGAGPRWENFVRASALLAGAAEQRGACLALETGPEPASIMEKLMRTVDSPGLKVNFDPANLILWPAALIKHSDLWEKTGVEPKPYSRAESLAEFEPVEGVRRLAPYIVHTHAKDAIGDGGWADVPLGTGWVDWPCYLGLLRAGGFDGYLTIEREGGTDRLGEIGAGVTFLREQLKALAATP